MKRKPAPSQVCIKRQHRFVVGFTGDRQVVYGKNDKTICRWAEPMTISQARRRVKELLVAKRLKRVIYEIVPVEAIR